MEIRPLSSVLGAEVVGVDLRKTLDQETARRIYAAWVKHSVIVFRGQELSAEDQKRFALLLGEIQIVRGKNYAQSDHMFIGNVEIDGRKGEIPYGEMSFHSDGCYYEVPMKAGTLYALEVPSVGGNTAFASGRRGYATLPARLREQVDDAEVLFIYDYIKNDMYRSKPDWADAPRFVHPLVIRHPDAGDPILYCNRLMADSVIGLDEEKSEALITELSDHLEQPENVYEHVWKQHDLLIWDNLAVAHARTDFDPNERRAMRRYTVRGSRPVAYYSSSTLSAGPTRVRT
jgi:taurine dioxygenase